MDPSRTLWLRPGTSEVLLGGEQQGVLGTEVVLHEPHRHARLCGHLANRRGSESTLEGDADDGLDDLAAAFLVVDSLRHASLWYACIMKSQAHLGRWRSEKGRQRFRLMEDKLWRDAMGVPPDAIDVETAYGPTRAYRWKGTGTPLVLLHGGTLTSLFWAPYADALAGNDIYAIDIMGDAGRSEHEVPFDRAEDVAAWLDETLAGLHIQRAHLVGHSLGGFVSLSAAVHRPSRVASLTL